MGRSAGAGSPVWFRCTKCRSTLNPARGDGSIDRVDLTGRSRPFRAKHYSALGSRSTSTAYEYVCRDCGHVGWSAHIDIAVKSGKTWEEARHG